MAKKVLLEVTGVVNLPSLGFRPIFQVHGGVSENEVLNKFLRSLSSAVSRSKLSHGYQSVSLATVVLRLGLLSDEEYLLRVPGTKVLRGFSGETRVEIHSEKEAGPHSKVGKPDDAEEVVDLGGYS